MVKRQKGTFAKATAVNALLLAAAIIVVVAIAIFLANAFELFGALCSVKIVANLVQRTIVNTLVALVDIIALTSVLWDNPFHIL